jgi:hypothetical protein
VATEDSSDPNRELQLNVDGDRIHLIVSPTELDIVVDALRSVGNVELAERFETVLRQFGQSSGRERQP